MVVEMIMMIMIIMMEMMMTIGMMMMNGSFSLLHHLFVPDGFPRVLRVSTESSAVVCGCVCVCVTVCVLL